MASHKILFVVMVVISSLTYFLLHPYMSHTHCEPNPKIPQDPDNYFINKQGLYLHKRIVMPPNHIKPKSLLIVVHGVGEHAGRDGYTYFSDHLSQQGIIVAMYDNQGHGRSQGDRVFFEHFQDFVDDTIQFAELQKKDFPNLPTFLFGHSMGSIIASKTMIQLQEQQSDLFKGLILSACCIYVDPSIATPTMVFIANILANFLPKIPLTGLPASELSRNTTAVERNQADPLNWKGGMLANTAVEVLAVNKIINEKLPTVTFPFHLFVSTADKICHPKGTELFYEGTSSTDKGKTEFKDGKHELFEDEEREAFFAGITKWIQDRL